MPKNLITIVGPTAIGKTSLSLKIADYYKTEIISADSRQFFKEMTIGTAVPSTEELERIPHHFIHHLPLTENYDVGSFEKDALVLIDQLFKKFDNLVMVGGSGLYVDAVLYGLNNFPEIEKGLRDSLNEQWKSEGLDMLQKKLKELDFSTYNKIDLNNPHRVIRALEVCISSGKPFSHFIRSTPTKRDFNSIIIGLSAERKVIYERINARVDEMITNGLVEEAKKLYQFKEYNSLNTVGYKELFKYFNNYYTHQQAIEEIKKNTRRFAKRQMTWFNKNKDIHWYDYQTPFEKIIEDLNVIIDEEKNK